MAPWAVASYGPLKPTIEEQSGSALAMSKLWKTDGAGLYDASPAWSAMIVQPPAARIVTVVPEIEQVLGVVEVKLTVSPDEAVALTSKSASPKVLSARTGKSIVWSAWPMSIETEPESSL